MACYYNVKIGNKIRRFTKLQLKIFLTQNGISEFDQLKNLKISGKFSLQLTKVMDKIDKAIENIHMTATDICGDDYELEGAMSLTRYIDEYGIPKWKDQPTLRMRVSDQDFDKYARLLLFAEGSMTDEEIEKSINQIHNQWDAIKVDSRDFHHLIKDVWTNRLLEDGKEGLFGQYIKDHYPRVYKKLSVKLPTKQSGLHRLFTTLQILQTKINVQLCNGANITYKGRSRFGKQFKALTVNNVPVGCNIDLLYVDDNGTIHVFNFKMTTSDAKTWAINKDMKYSYEMALIKKVLEANGIPVNRIDSNGKKVPNINLYNVPLVVQYNEDSDIISSVDINESSPFIFYNVRKDQAHLPKFENDVNQIIKNKEMDQSDMFDLLIDSDLINPDKLSRVINPDYNALSKGLQISAKSWIRDHANTDITWNNDTEEWDIVIDDNGTTLHAKDSSDILVNKEILEVVQKNIDKIDAGSPVVISALVEEIKNNYAVRGGFENRHGFRFNAAYAEKTFGPYFLRNKDDEHIWQFIQNESLWKCGILLFRNKETKQVDIVIPSAFHVNEYIPTKLGETNLLGFYESHMNSPTSLKSTYGNMEIIRALSVINEILPKLEDVKLGNISVITPFNGGQGITRSFREMAPEFVKIVHYLNNNVSGCDFKINFNKLSTTEPTELIYNLYNYIINADSLTQNQKNSIIARTNLSDLDSYKTKEAKLLKFSEIIESIEGEGKENSESIRAKLNSPNEYERLIGQIYFTCVEAVNEYYGMHSPEVKSISSLERYILPQYANPDTSVRYIANIYSRGLDQIALNFQHRYSPIRNKIMEFYKKVGHSKAKSMIIGSGESVFSKMFEIKDGKKTWNFINPYDDVAVVTAKLNKDEVEFLKMTLFELEKTKADGIVDYKFPYKDYNDPKLINKLNTDASFRLKYLWVPLERGSEAHQNRRSLNERLNGAQKEISKLKNSPSVKEYLLNKFREKQSESNFSDLNYSDKVNISDLTINNSILTSRVNGNVRRQMLNSHDESYFETNLEYILADTIEKQIATLELKKVAFAGKCLLFKMETLGDVEGESNKKLLRRSMEEVEKYLKLNVFGKSIMESSSQAIMEFLDPAKRLMSHMMIAANLRSAFRDTFEGIWQNTVRTMSHFLTDLTATSVMEGYKKVIKDIFNSDRDMDIMSELCLRYRLSNTDVAKIAERAKTGRGGIFNPSTLAYSTLRGPDFLNRMTLFSARCILDGVWEAFSLDEDHALKYDCTKDKRFKAYFNGDKNSEEYKTAKAKYYSAVLEYNKEHPNATITFDATTTPLPEPYSLNEIEQFKMFANGIYGAYDKSLKSMYEHVALGKTFGIFTTWLNGQTAAWFRLPGKYYEYFKTETSDGKPIIKKDPYSGNELWFDENGNIVEKTEDDKFINESGEEVEINNSFVPVLDKVPVEVQGILYTIKDSFNALFGMDGGIEEFKNRVLSNDYNVENFKKMGWDLGVLILFALLFGLVFTPTYKEIMKESDDLAEKMVVELLYKSSSTSYDGFMGIGAIANYVLNDVEPAAPNISIKLVQDGIKTLMGDKSFAAYTSTYVPVFRTFREPIKLMYPELFKPRNKV